MQYLKQSTASQSVVIGPFVDSTDGNTAETGLTISNTDIRLSKNGANIVAKNSGGGTHDELGYYTITLDATDTNTVGRLQLMVHETGALPVYHEYQVLEEDIYDALFGSSAAGFDSNGRVDVGSVSGTAQTAGDIPALVTTVDTVVDGIQTDLSNGTDGLGAIKTAVDAIPTSNPTAASIADAVCDEALSGHTTAGTLGKAIADIETDATAIVADTNELQTDWADGGRLDVILDARASQTSVDTVDTVADGIKVKTDQLTFTKSNELDSSVQSINGVTITGDGGATPFDVA